MRGKSFGALYLLVLAEICFAQDQIRVSSPKGDFVFDNLKFNVAGVTGTITNPTGVNLATATFDVQFFEATSFIYPKPTTTCTFVFKNVPPGQSDLAALGSTDNCTRYLMYAKTTKISVEFSQMEISVRPLLTFVIAKPTPREDLLWEDPTIKIKLKPAVDGIGFELTNKSGSPLEIDWNSVSYVDFQGEAHRVIHSGVRFLEKDQLLPPTVIPPMAKIDDLVYPADKVFFSDSWVKPELWPVERKAIASDPGEKKSSIEAELRTFERKTISIFLPIKVNGVLRNYNFIMRVAKVNFDDRQNN